MAHCFDIFLLLFTVFRSFKLGAEKANKIIEIGTTFHLQYYFSLPLVKKKTTNLITFCLIYAFIDTSVTHDKKEIERIDSRERD